MKKARKRKKREDRSLDAYRSRRSHRTDGRNGGMRNRIDRSKKEERNPPTRRQASALFTIDPLRRTDGRTDESHECPKGTRKRNTGSRSILRESPSGDARVNLSGPVSVKKREEFVPTMVNSSNRRTNQLRSAALAASLSLFLAIPTKERGETAESVTAAHPQRRRW